MNSFETPKLENSREKEFEIEKILTEEGKKESSSLVKAKRYLRNTLIGMSLLAGSMAFQPANAEAGSHHSSRSNKYENVFVDILEDLAKTGTGKVEDVLRKNPNKDTDQERRQEDQEYRMLLKQRDQTLREISQARTQEELNLAQEKYNIIDQKIKEIEMSQQAQ